MGVPMNVTPIGFSMGVAIGVAMGNIMGAHNQ